MSNFRVIELKREMKDEEVVCVGRQDISFGSLTHSKGNGVLNCHFAFFRSVLNPFYADRFCSLAWPVR